MYHRMLVAISGTWGLVNLAFGNYPVAGLMFGYCAAMAYVSE